jgi:hypothetical protein
MPDNPSSQSRYPGLERLMTIALGVMFLGVIAAVLLGVYALAAAVF